MALGGGLERNALTDLDRKIGRGLRARNRVDQASDGSEQHHSMWLHRGGAAP
jgi:hypothetical protein